MRKFFLWVGLFSLVASGANAASYQMIDGTIVDPIQHVLGGDLAYAGPNLEPGVNHYGMPQGLNLQGADLSHADLRNAALDDTNLQGADLSYADLSSGFSGGYTSLMNMNLQGADLSYANLPDAVISGATNLHNADLRYANLSGATLQFSYLAGADLTGADLTDAKDLGSNSGSAYYNAETDFTNALSGWFGSPLFDPVSAGWTLVPEPSTALLLGIGLAGLGMRRRAH